VAVLREQHGRGAVVRDRAQRAPGLVPARAVADSGVRGPRRATGQHRSRGKGPAPAGPRWRVPAG
jgi:hypothetical protein